MGSCNPPTLPRGYATGLNAFPIILLGVVNRARAFRVGSGLGGAWAWILKNWRASVGPDAGAKPRFLVSDRFS